MKSEELGSLSSDERYMRRALALAARARGATRPNPMVGAVIVAGGPRRTARGRRIVGEGFHRRAGGPHAEITALRAAGRRARGATLYVTLEPCCHTGRTPPCVPAIVKAGIRRVVAAMPDPNPVVGGRGLRRLRAARVATRVGVRAADAEALNPCYLTWRRLGRPFVTVKVAQSLDGKIATRTGASRWISGPAARRYAHTLRAQADAILVGVRTVLRDDPRLTVRAAGGRRPAAARPPLKVVLDATLRTPPTARVLRGGRALLATTAAAPAGRRRALAARGAEVIVFPGRGGLVNLPAVLRHLARREITSLVIEGGGEVIASALKARAVDRWVAIVAPMLIGGREAPTAVAGPGVSSLRQAVPLTVTACRRLGRDLIIEARINH